MHQAEPGQPVPRVGNKIHRDMTTQPALIGIEKNTLAIHRCQTGMAALTFHLQTMADIDLATGEYLLQMAGLPVSGVPYPSAGS